jgi:hypothetical protein
VPIVVASSTHECTRTGSDQIQRSRVLSGVEQRIQDEITDSASKDGGEREVPNGLLEECLPDEIQVGREDEKEANQRRQDQEILDTNFLVRGPHIFGEWRVRGEGNGWRHP